MFYNAKEKLLEIQDIQMNYITFGKGEKPLILIQGLSTRSIKGAAFSVAYMLICIECLQEIIKFICLITEKILAIA